MCIFVQYIFVLLIKYITCTFRSYVYGVPHAICIYHVLCAVHTIAMHFQDPDMFWDFITLRPETTHQVSFLFSDRGIPDGYRHMNGYGSHTFKLVNKAGEAVYCKFHFKVRFLFGTQFMYLLMFHVNRCWVVLNISVLVLLHESCFSYSIPL